MYKDYLGSLVDKNEGDYFSAEFYAESYAKRTGKKLVNSACSEHLDCGSRCCIPLDATPESESKFCQIESEVMN